MESCVLGGGGVVDLGSDEATGNLTAGGALNAISVDLDIIEENDNS